MFSHTNLKDRVAVITGGGGVLCGAFAKTLAAQGCKVAVLDLNKDAAQKCAVVKLGLNQPPVYWFYQWYHRQIVMLGLTVGVCAAVRTCTKYVSCAKVINFV